MPLVLLILAFVFGVPALLYTGWLVHRAGWAVFV